MQFAVFLGYNHSMKRTIVVGDLHGMYDDTIKLLEKCQATSNDRIIFAGDLIDRGPDNDKCVDLAMKHECVLGNHEARHISYDDDEKKNGKVNVSPSHVATRMQLRSEHYDYFRSLPVYIRLPEHNAAVVHAGVWPNRPLQQQSHHHLLHAQMIHPFSDNDGNINYSSKWPNKAPSHWKFWTHYWKGPERIIFGHSVLTKPLISEWAVGIDGGACFGRELWALVLPDWEIVSVSSSLDDSKLIAKRRINTFPIHGDVAVFS